MPSKVSVALFFSLASALSHHPDDKVLNGKIPEDSSVGNRVLIMLNGESARDRDGPFTSSTSCTEEGKKTQIQVTESQVENLFVPLTALGYEVQVWVIPTNDCGEEWEKQLGELYAPYLTEYVTPRKLSRSIEGRGVSIRIGADMLRQKYPSGYYSQVILSRPDVIFLNASHAKQFVNPDYITFPFKCENYDYPFPQLGGRVAHMVSDIIISMPFWVWGKFVNTAVGQPACFQREVQLNMMASGHGCLHYLERFNATLKNSVEMQKALSLPHEALPPANYAAGDEFRSVANSRQSRNPVYDLV